MKSNVVKDESRGVLDDQDEMGSKSGSSKNLDIILNSHFNESYSGVADDSYLCPVHQKPFETFCS